MSANFATGVINPLPLYPTKCVHILVLAKGLIALNRLMKWSLTKIKNVLFNVSFEKVP